MHTQGEGHTLTSLFSSSRFHPLSQLRTSELILGQAFESPVVRLEEKMLTYSGRECDQGGDRVAPLSSGPLREKGQGFHVGTQCLTQAFELNRDKSYQLMGTNGS